MSYFQRSIEHFLAATATDRAAIRASCLAKHPRGVNLVGVPVAALGTSFTPTACTDPGRVFVTYEQLVTSALSNPSALDAATKARIQRALADYDPQTELVWLFLTTRSAAPSELCLFVTSVDADQ